MSYETPDPRRMTVAQLKSSLSMHGFSHLLPTAKDERKDFYVNLYNEHVLPKLQTASSTSTSRSRDPAAMRKPNTGATMTSVEIERLAQQSREEEERQSSREGGGTSSSSSSSRRRQTMAGNEVASSSASSSAVTSASRGAMTPTPSSSSGDAGSATVRKRVVGGDEQRSLRERDLPASAAATRMSAVTPGSLSYITPATPIAPTERAPPRVRHSVAGPPAALVAAVSAAPRARTPPLASTPAFASSAQSTPASAPAPSASVSLPTPYSGDEVETSEEFAPEPEDHPVASQESWQTTKAGHKKSGGGSGGGGKLIVFAAVLGIAILGTVVAVAFAPGLASTLDTFFTTYVQPLPYFCDTTGRPTGHGGGTGPEDCVMCPSLGVCNNGKLVQCKKGYVVSGGRSCVQDEEIMKRAHLMKDEVHRVLSLRAGAYQCELEDAPTPDMTEREVKEALKERDTDPKGKGIGGGGARMFVNPVTGQFSEAKFEESFMEMRKQVLAHPEWNVRVSARQPVSGGPHVSVYSTTDIALPFSCQLRLFLWEYKWYELLIILALGSIIYVVSKRKQAKRLLEEVDELVEEVKDLLVAQKQRSSADRSLPPYIPITHVRDTLFHDNPHRKSRFVGNKLKEKERVALWRRVEDSIAGDRRIRTVPVVVDGQQQTTWEWASLVDPATVTPRKTMYGY